MFRLCNLLRLVIACGFLAFVAGQADALPGVKAPTGGHNGKNKNAKPTDPLESAIKDLTQAEKDLDAKDGSAGRLTKSAEQIVSGQEQQAKQARDQALERGTATKEQKEHLKARITALEAVLKDIRSAHKAIGAHKTEDAKSSLQSAVTGLEGLTGGGGGKKKK